MFFVHTNEALAIDLQIFRDQGSRQDARILDVDIYDALAHLVQAEGGGSLRGSAVLVCNCMRSFSFFFAISFCRGDVNIVG